MALLEARNLVSGYGKLAIVQDVSFSVDEGEVIALIGPNGSGKTTLIKSIFGLATIFEGKVLFGGKEIMGTSPENVARMGLGYVPQIGNVFPDLTVAENLELGATTNRNGSKRELFNGVFQMFPILKERERQKAGTLSGGERQMLAIGRGLMAQPKMMLLDEPTAALSPIAAQQVVKKIVEIQKAGITLLLAEQNARQALNIATRGIVLVQGKKAFDGMPEKISKDEDIIRIYLGTLGKESGDE